MPSNVSLAVTFDRFTREKHTTGYLDQWVTLACFFGCTRLIVIDEDFSGAAERWYDKLAIPTHSDVGALTEVECFADERPAIGKYLDDLWVHVEQPRKLFDLHAMDVSSLISYHHERIRSVVYYFGPNARGFDVKHDDPRPFVTIEPLVPFPGLWSIQAASMVLYDRMVKGAHS